MLNASKIETGLKDMCSSATLCCASITASHATNPEWNQCMTNASDKGAFTKPDFHILIPGGISGEVTGRARADDIGNGIGGNHSIKATIIVMIGSAFSLAMILI